MKRPVAGEELERNGCGDRRDLLGENAAGMGEIVGEAHRVHVVVIADQHVDPVIGGRQRHLHLGDDAVRAIGVVDLLQLVAGQVDDARLGPPW